MTWLEIKVDLTRIAKAIERLADAVDRLSPPPAKLRPHKPAVFLNVEPSAIAEAEEEADRKREAGTK